MTAARTLVALVFGLLWSALAQGAAAGPPGQLAVRWDCYLAELSVECGELESAFFQAVPILERAEQTAALLVTVRGFAITGGDEFTLSVTSPDGRDYLVLTDRVPSTFSLEAGGRGGGADTGGGGGRGTGGGDGNARAHGANVVIVRLVADLQRAVTPFLSLERAVSVEEGRMTLVLRSPSLGPAQARADDSSAPWYLSPSLVMNLAQTALLQVSAAGNLESNWSTPEHRLLSQAAASYSFISSPAPNEATASQSYGSANASLSATGVKVLSGGLSVGNTAIIAVAPERNQQLRLASFTGLEWVLLPFLATNAGNVGARYVIGGEHQQYVHLTERKRFEESFLRHQALLFAAWHFERLDVSAALSASSLVDDLTFSDISAAGSVSWRVWNDLSVTLTGSASFRNALINKPDNLNELDPLERFVGGGNFGALTYTTRLSILYAIGNSLLLRQDQRWSNGAEP